MELLFERFISNERLVDCYIDYSKSGNSNWQIQTQML
jgi:hypothetical protein